MTDAGGHVHEPAGIAYRPIALGEAVDQKIVPGSPESRLQEARAEPSAEIIPVPALVPIRLPAVLGEIEDAALETQPLGAAEQVPVRPIGPQRRPVRRGILGRRPDDPQRPLGELHEKREIAVGVQDLGLADAHRAQRLDLGDRLAHGGQCRGGIRIARFGVDEGAHHGRVDALGPLDRDRPDAGLRPRIDAQPHIHHLSLVVDDRILPLNFGEGARLGAEIIDDARLGGEDVGGAGRVSRLDLHHPRRKLARRIGQACPRVEDVHIPEGELRPRICDDLDGHESPRPVAGRGPDRRLRARRLQDHRHARHVDRHAGIVVPRAPERIDQARQIGLRAADEGRGIGGGSDCRL